jgi:hypothetical protein
MASGPASRALAPDRAGAPAHAPTSGPRRPNTPSRPQAKPVSYRGRTSQRRPISFTLSGRFVTKLRYRIVDSCGHGRRLYVRAWGFPPLAISHGRFGGRFVAKSPHQATAVVTGRITAGSISGSLSDRSQDSKTRSICHGRATFRLPRR